MKSVSVTMKQISWRTNYYNPNTDDKKKESSKVSCKFRGVPLRINLIFSPPTYTNSQLLRRQPAKLIRMPENMLCYYTNFSTTCIDYTDYAMLHRTRYVCTAARFAAFRSI